MKVRLEEVSTDEFLNEEKVEFSGKKTEMVRRLNASKKVSSLVQRIRRNNPGKKVSFSVTELNEEQLKSLRKKVLAKNVKNFLITSVVAAAFSMANSTVSTAAGLTAAGRAGAQIGGAAVNKATRKKWFLIKFNLKDVDNRDSFLMMSDSREMAASVVSQAVKNVETKK